MSELADQSLKALETAVATLNGTSRPGQETMISQVAEALHDETHVLVQAGTGTGKSLGYLIPAMIWAIESKKTAMVATATLALQAQLAHKDIPVAARAVAAICGREPRTQILKGRSNYICLLRVRGQDDSGQDELLDEQIWNSTGGESPAEAVSSLGHEVLALRQWAEDEAKSGRLADRDDAPSHSPRAWAQVSVPTRECLGSNACPYAAQCFVEEARARARQADLVITNHALLAINAMHGEAACPEFGPVIVDEAHELVSRITGAATSELSAQLIERVAKRAGPWLDDDVVTELAEAAQTFGMALDEAGPGRITGSSVAVDAASLVREVSRRALSRLTPASGETAEPAQQQVSGAMKEVFDIAERIAKCEEQDVVWVSTNERIGSQLNVAPLSVSGLMRQKVLNEHPTILTSATLTVGGDFEPVAGSVGLARADRIAEQDEPTDSGQWRAVDVGSPFDYPRQGILYVASQLPNPVRGGIGAEALAELAELIWAADGRTLGLFASQRSAQAAADHLRTTFPALTVMCQGEVNLSELTREFIRDERSVLLGTLSLWQGIDVPGDTCRLVVIDKIPFPRPDDPLMQARQQAVTDAGGSGFMQVAASHAALLLAQGAGRLIRSSTDKGVVAVLDPRLVKSGYSNFLRASLPPFWMTTDRDIAVQALQRLSAPSL